jgi:hypothetical protein
LQSNFADMVKLVDMPDLGSGAARRVGSSPIIRTKTNAITYILSSCVFWFIMIVSNYKNLKIIFILLILFNSF